MYINAPDAWWITIITTHVHHYSRAHEWVGVLCKYFERTLELPISHSDVAFSALNDAYSRWTIWPANISSILIADFEGEFFDDSNRMSPHLSDRYGSHTCVQVTRSNCIKQLFFLVLLKLLLKSLKYMWRAALFQFQLDTVFALCSHNIWRLALFPLYFAKVGFHCRSTRIACS